ncbi:hypothetical protein GGTG_05717 [Gaeumannomyces tritici R3-111a-1]|uniref:GATA-type domain-containing protein n=1 Tax=Gaeumannomyces tritici (strain R3-111a-1) TaxID=644352 RepID=J3NWQ5_GAET3|nr:hypothetical protein GGTG_05717 [Gaeumannomyces tritici R3-111a-1]EJT75787.1 hypothetical protein GGTG_05717 [Gaeumannomyces tritici R3-111a-1]
MSAAPGPQAFTSSYAPRLRTYNNSLLVPVINTPQAGPIARTTKRGTTVINYAEDGYDDYDDDDDDSRRRPTGLRSLRRDDSVAKVDPSERVGKDTTVPVEVAGIWRDWMGKSRIPRPDAQNYAQASLPLTLIPIRLDVEIPSFIPAPNIQNVNDSTQKQEMTVPYRLKDSFMWNLHETLITTDQFAQQLVHDLDLPNRNSVMAEISKQIRTQLEEYAGVALHPLFHSAQKPTAGPVPPTLSRADSATPTPQAVGAGRSDTPLRGALFAPATPSRLGPGTPVPTTSMSQAAPTSNAEVTATAEHASGDSDDLNLDDTYRCVVTLNIYLGSHLYTDKFEWSLLHPPGTAEAFAKVTCADLGLSGEWVPAMTHAIYEAVLRLKKEACESGGLVVSGAGDFPGADASSGGPAGADGAGAGWRHDPEHLADDWEPRVEPLSKEEMEKREGDRERQIRRLRRETARFSSNTGMVGGVPVGFGFGGLIEQEEERMGRGERSKKKRRFRSLSPLGRSGTPGGRGTPDVGASSGGYGGGGTLTDTERSMWRCSHCKVWGTCVWAVRDGPHGPRSLCNNCGFTYERDRKLPRWTKNMHANDMRFV